MRKNATLMKEYSEWLFEEDHSSIIYEKNSEMLTESSIARATIQYAIAAALEYGSIATIAGAPAGPVAETIIDGIFALNSVRNAVESLSDIRGNLRKGEDIVDQVINQSRTAIRDGWSSFYDVIKEIWRNIEHFQGDRLEEADEIVEEIKQEIESLLDALKESIADAIKVVIPDATLSLAAGEAIKYALTNLSENPYTAVTAIMARFPMLDKFLRNPESANQAFQEIYRIIIAALDNLKSDLSNPDASIRQRLVRFGIGTYVAGPLAGAALASNAGGRLSSSVIERVISFLNENEQQMLELIQNILTVLFPSMFGLLASVQILMKGEWRTDENEEETSSGSESPEQLTEDITYTDMRFKKLAGLLRD